MPVTRAHRTSLRNPTENYAPYAMWRSVSVDELVDIIVTGRITGRGNAFSHDDRDYVFFGIDGPDAVIHHGEDTGRQIATRPEFMRRITQARTSTAPQAIREVFWAIDADAARERKELSAKYGATSFILELSKAPGGTWFHGGESRDGRDEVGYERRPGVSTRYVTTVYPVLDRRIVGETTLDGAADMLGIGNERASEANPTRRRAAKNGSRANRRRR